jgi:hypothetical protein
VCLDWLACDPDTGALFDPIPTDSGMRCGAKESPMKNGCLVGFLAALAVLSAQVNAADCVRDSSGNVVCGRGQCATDQYGKVLCAKNEGGGAMRDQYGDVKCGVGYCAIDDLGEIKCSTRPGGGAATDSYGKVKCLGGCQSADRRLCEAPR